MGELLGEAAVGELLWGRCCTGAAVGNCCGGIAGLLWEESSHGHGKKAVTMFREIFSEARLMDAVLVLDGWELDIGASEGIAPLHEESCRSLTHGCLLQQL